VKLFLPLSCKRESLCSPAPESREDCAPDLRRVRALSSRATRNAIAILALACAAEPLSAASILDWIFPKHDVQVVTVTDTTPAGALRRPVSPASPAYYAAVNAGYRDFGGIIAGEKIPPKDEVVKTIVKVLAKQGYLPSSDAHAPSLLLVWTWGTMNTDRFYTGSTEEPDGRQINRNQLLRFMGAYKLGLITKEPDPFRQDTLLPGAWIRDADSEMISDLASEDLYVIAISAYDYAAALRQEKTLLWMTKISCPSRGLSMPQTLPAMLALAAPHIGRETAKPVMVKGSEEFKAEVKIGDPTVVEFLEKTPLPVVDASSNTPKKAPAPKQPKKR
jgi:hypothetical protein